MAIFLEILKVVKSMLLKILEQVLFNILSIRDLGRQLKTNISQMLFQVSWKAKILSISEEALIITVPYPITATNKDKCNKPWTMPSKTLDRHKLSSKWWEHQAAHLTNYLNTVNNNRNPCSKYNKKWTIMPKEWEESVIFHKL